MNPPSVLTMSSALVTEFILVKPRLRGIPHSIGALVAIPATILCIAHATSGDGALAATIYGLSLIFLLSTSAIYHTGSWRPRLRMWLRRVDHLAIFVLIAGSYTPICLLALPQAEGQILLGLVWSMAGLGALLSLFWPMAPRWLNVSLTIAMGWVILPVAALIINALEPASIALLLVGGLLYSMGGVAYAKRAPNPLPAFFGHHEVFHCLVLAAAACHYAAIWRLVA
jgi:hemolysin III